MAQTHRLILDELEDRVEQIFEATERLREVAGDGKTSRQLLDSIFRNVHSVKASAASHDLNDLAQIAHQFENLLHALRTGKTQMRDEVLIAFDSTANAMFSCLRETDNFNKGLEQLSERLVILSETPVRRSLEVEVVLNAVPPEIWKALSQEEKHRLEQVVGEGASLFLIETRFDIANFDQLFQDLKNKLSRSGELISTAPTAHNQTPDKIDFRILFANECDLEQTKAELSGLDNVVVSEIPPHPTATTNIARGGKEPAAHGGTGAAQVIRIELHDLDRLIASTQQLFRQASACLDQTGILESPTVRGKVDQIGSSLLRLAADLVDLRMNPIDRVMQRALRVGRSAAAAAEKEIKFSLAGNDLRIDKSLSDAISDPLVHLVRNAVDHGIENKAERVAAGKEPCGNIKIEASTLQGRTVIRVTDDGRGIDPDLIRSVAQRMGLIAENAEVNMDKSVRLIFRAGFSTANNVSEISGRGVGLDVVESAIEEVGGAIRVRSEPGQGAVFEILLPVTFSLLDVIVVREAKHCYLIDAKQSDSTATDDVNLTNQSLVSYTLSKLIGQESVDTQPREVIVCNLGSADAAPERLCALEVNELIGTERVLVRNLGSHAGRWLGVAGAAELRDGTVALLLDLPTLTAMAGNAGVSPGTTTSINQQN